MQELEILSGQIKKACQKIKTLEEENAKLRRKLISFEEDFERLSHLGPKIRKLEENNNKIKKKLNIFREKLEKIIVSYEGKQAGE